MKKIFLLAIGFCFSGLLSAQVKPKSIAAPVVKQTQIATPDINIGNTKPVTAASTIKRALPVTVNENLAFYKWKASRWMQNSMWSGYLSAQSFRFNTNGTVSCEASIFSVGDNQLVNGTYVVSGNNVTVTIKKGTSEIMTCNLVYDNATKKLNGTYILEVFDGKGFLNGAEAEMKLEINPI